jgi:L-alanine-DL-glutamate epimerase-like enolase superfamily enzyme
MADRPVNTAESAAQYIGLGAGAIQLKAPGMGYRESRRIVDVAEAAGVPCVVGISSGTGLRGLVGLHFRAAIRHLDKFPSESIFFLRLAEDVLEEPLQVADGAIELSDSPGFGVRISPDVLRKIRAE